MKNNIKQTLTDYINLYARARLKQDRLFEIKLKFDNYSNSRTGS